MKRFRDFIQTKQTLGYAKKAHSGQARSSGEPYIEHPKRVAELIRKYKKSHNLDALIRAAYLHDTIEDTDTTFEDLERMFGGLVASLVKELTSDKEKIAEIGKSEYLSQKMANMSSWALVIKLADRVDNVSDIATAKTPEWRKKYKKQTLEILRRLEKDRKLTRSHKILIKLIKNKLDEIED